ncbi:hypothetical protein MWU38_05140 [Qipengyuania sp. S6317L1]|uniref:spike base protein, RCAP_Rcc01079 family n=1 Tax=Qipengyuania sp. S6317L1 TaxID=2926410 RepID=UPI001FF317EE|nr:hypothetical protein [Qipengyuania sp. S6317L1]MCK0098757.1 hypothetical protein [Qipengyuania sp. S6317L1]
MPQDHFSTIDSVTSPSRDWFDIAPSDSADLGFVPKAIYVGTGGDLVVSSARTNTEVTFRNIPSGAILDIRPAAVRQTGTTATDLVGLI